MNNDSMDSNIKRFYSTSELSSQTLERLTLMTETSETAPVKPPRHFAIAAGLAITLLTAAQLIYIFEPTQSDLILRVAQEVELNHSKHFDSDFPTGDITQLAASMNRLNFDLTLPERLRHAGYTLLGGRYCSIQGEIAAQLRLKNTQGIEVTLYATKANDSLTSLHNKQQQRGDVLIQTWQEAPLFFSLAVPL